MIASTAIFAVLAVTLVVGVNAGAPRKTVVRQAANHGEFPYQVSLRSSGEHHCSGAIISSRHILTTASCVVGVTNLTVVTGTLYNNACGDSQKPNNVVYHQLYQPNVTSSAFDIAVISVSEDIVFNEDQNMIPLQTELTSDVMLATVTGWGLPSTPRSEVLHRLKKMQLSTISRENCQTRVAPIEISIDQICTYIGTQFCMIDRGSPLVFNDKLIGLLSYGISCDIAVPDVFTGIYYLRDWINATINAE